MISKIFNGDYVVESKLANLLGAQLVRYIAAKTLLLVRAVAFSWKPSAELKLLQEDGVITIENFLNDTDFNKVLEEFEKQKVRGTYSPIQDGSTFCERYVFNDENIEFLPVIQKLLLQSSKLKELIEGLTKRTYKIDRYIWLDEITNGDPKEGEDSQKELHVDIFYTTIKVWFFVDDVKLEDGPLSYVKKSHKFNFKRLVFEYFNSVNYRSIKSHAFRVTPSWLEFIRPREYFCVVPKNTLVIADTSGYHRRGDAKPGKSRKQIHFRVRSNPFSKILER